MTGQKFSYYRHKDLDEKLMKALQEHPLIDRSGLVELLEVPRTTIHDHIRNLQLKGVEIRKVYGRTRERGRPKVYYQLENGGKSSE